MADFVVTTRVRLGFKISAQNFVEAHEIVKKLFENKILHIDISGVRDAAVEDFKALNVSIA